MPKGERERAREDRKEPNEQKQAYFGSIGSASRQLQASSAGLSARSCITSQVHEAFLRAIFAPAGHRLIRSEERRQLEPELAFWSNFASAKAAHVLFLVPL